MIWRMIDLVYCYLPRAVRRWLARTRLSRYRNPDPRCTYVFEPSLVGYCCGYAVLIDLKTPLREIEKFCRGCPLWVEERNAQEATDGRNHT